MNELLHWLVDHVEALIEDRAAAHELVDQLAAPAPDENPPEVPQTPADGSQAAGERGPEPGEGGSQS